MEYAFYLLLVVVNGIAIVLFLRKSKDTPAPVVDPNHVPQWAQQQLEEWRGKAEQLQQQLDSERGERSTELLKWTEEKAALEAKVAIAEEKWAAEQRQFEAHKAAEKQAKEAMTNEFKVLADQILEEKSKSFKSTNSEELDKLLSPFKEKLENFERRVNETHTAEMEQAGSLKAQLRALQEMNLRLSDEASGLAKALRGDTKKQGNWGEFVLERALEMSGLVKDQEYFVQNSETTEDGRRLQPDVVIQLPGQKKIVVDSKVSLVAWDAFVNAEDQEEAQRQLKLHGVSVRNHVKGLSEKDYAQLYPGETPDFVLLFIPIEPAFMEVTKFDPTLYEYAFERKIIIVSNSTLLATLKTIALSWRQEKQTKHVIEIAEAGGKLYDKFSGLAEDLVTLGNQFNTAQKTYSNTMKKMSEGRGNLISQVERLKSLGAKAKKDMDAKLLERSRTDDQQ